jgi:hypothetical protein
VFICVLVLCFTQILLIVLCLGLARDVALHARRVDGTEEWPLGNISPGQLLPRSILTQHGLSRASEGLLGENEIDGFYVCAVTTLGLGPLRDSIAELAQEWRLPVIMFAANEVALEAFRSVNSLHGLSYLPKAVNGLGVKSNTIFYVKDRRIVDATSTATTPTSLRHKFSFVIT